MACSTVNYTNLLAIPGKSAVLCKFPIMPRIDFAGMVAQSSDACFNPGDAAL